MGWLARQRLAGRGRVIVWDKRGNGLSAPARHVPTLDERVDEARVVDEATAAGLRLLRKETFLPFQYFLVFGRADASGSTAAESR